jgi:hypothetical protein
MFGSSVGMLGPVYAVAAEITCKEVVIYGLPSHQQSRTMPVGTRRRSQALLWLLLKGNRLLKDWILMIRNRKTREKNSLCSKSRTEAKGRHWPEESLGEIRVPDGL